MNASQVGQEIQHIYYEEFSKAGLIFYACPIPRPALDEALHGLGARTLELIAQQIEDEVGPPMPEREAPARPPAAPTAALLEDPFWFIKRTEQPAGEMGLQRHNGHRPAGEAEPAGYPQEYDLMVGQQAAITYYRESLRACQARLEALIPGEDETRNERDICRDLTEEDLPNIVTWLGMLLKAQL